MHLSSLRLYNFRNLTDATIQFPAGVCCIVGDNGQGKTNLVEAISLLSLARSFRTANLRELIKRGESAASVFAVIQGTAGGDAGPFEVGLSIEENTRKGFLYGKQTDSVTALLGMVPCVTFSPTDLSLVKGAPQNRRRFLDTHLVDLEPGMVRAYQDFQRAYRSKNALLKAGHATLSNLQPWNEVLAKPAAQIVNARLRLLRQLEQRLVGVGEKLFQKLGAISFRLKGTAKESFGGVEEHEHTAEITPERMLELLSEVAEREIAKQSTLLGPHRDDLVMQINDLDARAYASQGQARSLVLALKLAVIELLEAQRKESPLILLDDVDSELDQIKRRAIFSAILAEKKRQVFVTATEYRLPEEVRGSVEAVMCIKDGVVMNA